MFIKISHHHLLVESIGSFEHAFTNLKQGNPKTIPRNIAQWYPLVKENFSLIPLLSQVPINPESAHPSRVSAHGFNLLIPIRFLVDGDLFLQKRFPADFLFCLPFSTLCFPSTPYCLPSEALAKEDLLPISPSPHLPTFFLRSLKCGWDHLEIAIKLNFWYK